MSGLPIRVRLTLAFVLVMAVVLAAMALLVYVRVGSALLTSVDQSLTAQAREAAARKGDEHSLIDPDVAGGTTVAQFVDTQGLASRSTPSTLHPLLGRADAIRVGRGSALRRSGSLPGLAGEWRLLAVPAAHGNGAVVVARPLTAREETLDRLLRELLLAVPLALVVASFAGYGLAAAALRPVEAMRRRAAAVTAASAVPLPVPPGNDEISRLAETLNDMLERLRASFEHERRFVADASHELRTPLALLRTELELALRRPRSAGELEAAVRSAAEETERLSRLADDLLLVARAEQGAIRLRVTRTDADELLGDTAARFGARASELGRTITVERSTVVVPGDRDRLEQALSNLVANALAHGAGEIRLAARERDGGIELHVRDEGPGFPTSFLARAFDRFSRADDARGRGGSGLGLSIVGLIAEAHGGRAAALNGPYGGADVWLELPREAATERPRPA